MSTERPRHVHSLDHFTHDQLEGLLATADKLRNQRALSHLKGKAVVLLFLNPSLRTRVSMELAARQLGADVVTLEAGAGLWKLEFADGAVMRGDAVEHVKDAVRVLARYGDLLGVRAFPHRKSWDQDRRDPVFSAFMEYSTVPVLNLESCLYHPCQALADVLTIQRAAATRASATGASATGAKAPGTSATAAKVPGTSANRDRKGAETAASDHHAPAPCAAVATATARQVTRDTVGKVLLTWADHPKALPVAVPNSFALAVTQMGWDLTIARPEGYDLPDEVMARCRELARANGGKLEVTADRDAAFAGARFVYAKSWGRLDRYGDEAREIEDRRAAGLDAWCVDGEAMRATDDACFMHCLPVRRNVVVTDEVIDGPRSVVADQAENRLHAQKALLLEQFGVSS